MLSFVFYWFSFWFIQFCIFWSHNPLYIVLIRRSFNYTGKNSSFPCLAVYIENIFLTSGAQNWFWVWKGKFSLIFFFYIFRRFISSSGYLDHNSLPLLCAYCALNNGREVKNCTWNRVEVEVTVQIVMSPFNLNRATSI